MANQVKGEEKNERIIRGLLKLPENRRCINCNSLGPQYVCTNFWTFVCTTCSGIHREFTHRVKSVSMANFTSQEVGYLQGGGNARAKEVYFKEWDPTPLSVPNSSNVDRLRNFIKHVYVDRKYTGERSVDRLPRAKMVDGEDCGSRDPHYEDTYRHHYAERSGPAGRNNERNFRYSYNERRKPGYDQDGQKYKRIIARFEVADDRIWDDRSGNRISEDNWFSKGELKLEGGSHNQQKVLDTSSPQVVSPVRDILGEHFPTLRVGEPSKTNVGRASNGSANTRRTVSLRSMSSIDEKLEELKRAISGCVIVFDADPEPAMQTRESPSTGQSITEPTSSSIIDNNWAIFNCPTREKVSQAASCAKTMESVSSQFSVPAAAPVESTSMLPVSGDVLNAKTDNMPMVPGSGVSAAVTVSNMSGSLSGGSAPAPAAAPSGTASSLLTSKGNSFIKVNDEGQEPSLQQPHHSSFLNAGSHSTPQQFTPSVGGSNYTSCGTSFAPNSQGSLSTPSLQSSQSVLKQTHDTVSPLPTEKKSSGRKDLLENLFTEPYSSVPVQVPGWQSVQHRSVAYGMQYPSVVHEPAFPQPSKSTNPFDLLNESNLVQVSMVPSMASLKGTLPNEPVWTGLSWTSSLHASSPQWMTSQSLPYAAAMPPTSGMPPSAYKGQEVPSNLLLLGHQGVGGFVSDGALFGTLNTSQQLGGKFYAPATSNCSSSVRENPFW